MPHPLQQNLSKLGQQLLGIWKQLGLNQRITVAFTGLAAILTLGALAYWSGRPNYTLLYGNLDPAEAGHITAALTEAKVPYQIGHGGNAILVPADRVYETRMQLATKGVLKGEGLGWEILDRPNFGMSDFLQHKNYIRALQGELARTIGQLDNVASASVSITLPENRLLLADRTTKPTAAVLLRMKGFYQLAAPTVEAIRFLVANSVEGLSANNVVVTDNRGNMLAGNREDDSISGLSTTQLSARREYEAYLAKQAQSLLETVVGPGRAVVRVAAELNWDTLSRTEERFDPEGVMRTSTVDDETLDTANGEHGSQPVGTATNASTETNKVAGVTNTSKTRKKKTTSNYELNRTTSTLAQAAGHVRRLSAAVFIAARFKGTGSDRKIDPRDDKEIEKLRRTVQSAIGIMETGDTNRQDQLTLEEMPFEEDGAAEVNRQMEKDTRQRFYLDLGRNVGFGLLGLGMLIAFWKLMNRPADQDLLNPTAKAAADKEAATAEGEKEGNGSNIPVFPGRKKAPGPGVVTVDMLNELIRENPEGMTQAVRSWLTRGSNVNN